MNDKRHLYEMDIVGWRAWYCDNRYFDSTTTTWEELPANGALYFILYHKTRPYSRIMSGRSLYWRETTNKGDIFGYDNVDDALISQATWDANRVKRGKWVTDNEMHAVHHEANQWPSIAPDESLRIDKPF